MLERNIFIYWGQGWENAPWLQRQVAESWQVNNPKWNIHLLDKNNLKNYISDVDYLYDTSKRITRVNESDVIRISLLKNHGGVWADSTLLCMQPLDGWADEAVTKTGFWMYRGYCRDIPPPFGPASWFILSKKNSYIILKWKMLCDDYWNSRNQEHDYFWLDSLFSHLYYNDEKFNSSWQETPALYCELDGSCHTLAVHGMQNNTPFLKDYFLKEPPYALKLWWIWNSLFPDVNTKECKNSNGYFAIQMSKRCFRYKHIMF